MKMKTWTIAALAAFGIGAPSVESFAGIGPNLHIGTTAGTAAPSSPLFANLDERSEEDDAAPSSASANRRSFVASTAAAALSASLPFFPSRARAADGVDDAASSSIAKPICVIGANGKTGSECVGNCISRSVPVVATSRGGTYTGVYASEGLLSTASCDVTDPATISASVEGSRAVIFAASASKQGGTAAAVDNEGLVNVARACIEARVPHLVIVSSGGVSKPDSPVYKFLNIFGKIMEEKIRGEDAVRALYKGLDPAVCTYTVVRPGGLTEEPGRGVSALELNQGDVKSGRIARADVAALCVESTFYPGLTGGTTYECYDADTAKPLGSVGMSNIMKSTVKDDEVVVKTGKERRGDTFEQIFTGLSKD